MSVLTNHWSGSPPVRLRAYHVEIGLTGTFTDEDFHNLRALHDQADGYKSVPWATLRAQFNVWKNDSFTTATDYGTWDFNTDPRDGSPNVEVASMCLPGGATDFGGQYPFTIAHAWMHAGIAARICQLKGLDTLGSFPASVAPQLQNGPINVISIHGERAIQTVNWNVPGAGASSEAASLEFGYFFGSGDPNSRADLFCLDGEYYDGTVTVAQCKASAAWIRENAHLIKAAGITDFWGLDGPETP